jgi:hypothetical protein
MAVKTYTKAFKNKIVKLANKGNNIYELAQKYGCSAASIDKWIRQDSTKQNLIEKRKRKEGLAGVNGVFKTAIDRRVVTFIKDNQKYVRFEDYQEILSQRDAYKKMLKVIQPDLFEEK